MNCKKCGCIHYEHPDANKNGGVGRLMRFSEADEYCGVCRDYRSEKQVEAVWRLIEHRTKTDTEQTTLETEPKN